MNTDTRAAKVVRGLVKTVFIGCYIAFMWASIHHLATFFNSFEADNGNMLGSYLLAGAIDITALVTTIGVMFFRKSMPTWVFWIVWIFIIGIAVYSFIVNWEYASHYQSMELAMQPTGETTPVYDAQGVLHYVPVMKINTGLLWMNPILSSGFTIFSLVYSVIAEFFGTKPPTIAELEARRTYLQETASVLNEIKQLEEKNKGTSLIQRVKETVKEAKSAVKEVLTSEESHESEEVESSVSQEVIEEESIEHDVESNASDNEQTNAITTSDKGSGSPSKTPLKLVSKGAQNGSTSRVYVSIQEVVEILGYDLSYVKSLRTKGVLRSSRKNSDLISMASVKALLAKKQSAVKRQGEEQSENEGTQTDTPTITVSVETSEERDRESVVHTEATV